MRTAGARCLDRAKPARAEVNMAGVGLVLLTTIMGIGSCHPPHALQGPHSCAWPSLVRTRARPKLVATPSVQPARPWPPSRAEWVDYALSAAGATFAITALSVLDRLTPFRFYAPPYGAIVLLLFGAKRLPELGAMAAATLIALSTAQLMSLLRLPIELVRGLSCGLILLLIRLCGAKDYAPSAALALFFIENCEPRSPSLSKLFCPAFSGHAVVLPIAWVVLYLRQRVRAALGHRERDE